VKRSLGQWSPPVRNKGFDAAIGTLRLPTTLTKLNIDARDPLAVLFNEIFEKHAQQLVRSVSSARDCPDEEHVGACVPLDVERTRQPIPP
jgi:hypothetical protein